MLLRCVPNPMQICYKWWLLITTINRGAKTEEFRSILLGFLVWHELGSDRLMKQIIHSPHTHDEAHLHKYFWDHIWWVTISVRWQHFSPQAEPSFPAHHRCKLHCLIPVCDHKFSKEHWDHTAQRLFFPLEELAVKIKGGICPSVQYGTDIPVHLGACQKNREGRKRMPIF